MKTGIKEVVGWPVAGIWSLKANRGAQRCLSEVFARLASRASPARAGVRVVVSGRNAAQLGLGAKVRLVGGDFLCLFMNTVAIIAVAECHCW